MNIINAFRHHFFSKFYLLIPISIIGLACLGSAAAYFISIKGNSLINFFQMFACVSAAMSYLAVLLGQFKKEILFKVLLSAILIETILLAINLPF
ncbi:MAG: hypothetical protein VW127_06320 [Flavobacteriaceae bacterium]|jgi:hypothetical protein